MEAVTQLDVTGIQAQIDIRHELERKGVQMLLARPIQFVLKFREHLDAQDRLGREILFKAMTKYVKFDDVLLLIRKEMRHTSNLLLGILHYQNSGLS